MDGNRNIEGYSNYFVTEDGQIWSYKTNRFIKLTLNRGGYYWLNLSRPGEIPKAYRVHRLVAKAYLGKTPEDRPDVNHIDGNKTNNHFSNLEWSNKSLNGSHAHRTGLNIPNPRKGVDHGMATLLEEDILKIRELRKTMTNKELGIMFNISSTQVWRIVTRKSWKHI